MTKEELAALAEVMAVAVKEQVDAATRPLLERIASLEARAPKDGVGVAGAVIDRAGNLVLTLSDGSVRDLGPVVGKDADPAQPGKDGLGFEDMTEELADDGRTIVRRYARGDQVKEFRHSLAVVLDRGVYKAGGIYEAGDGVTWAGSFWIAQEKTTEKPDSGQGWRLAVKRGRDGKDALAAPPRPKDVIRVGVPASGD